MSALIIHEDFDDLQAQYLSALASGLAVQSSSGVSSAVLNKVVDQVISNWPS